MKQKGTALENKLTVANDHTGKEDRQEAAAAEIGRQAEGEQAGGRDQHGIQAGGGQVDMIDDAYRDPPHAKADNGTDPHLLNKHHEQARPQGHVVEQHLEQAHGQENGHRVVGSTFDFQRRLDAWLDVNTGIAQQGKYRSGIGRADDSAYQHAFQQWQVKDKCSGQARNESRDQYP